MNINLLVNKYLIVIKPSPFTFSLEYLACAIIKFNILVKPTLASFLKIWHNDKAITDNFQYSPERVLYSEKRKKVR